MCAKLPEDPQFKIRARRALNDRVLPTFLPRGVPARQGHHGQQLVSLFPSEELPTFCFHNERISIWVFFSTAFLNVEIKRAVGDTLGLLSELSSY